jgi:endonuclease/exonuclease/phosphatase family metal-dependent hydrolase
MVVLIPLIGFRLSLAAEQSPRGDLRLLTCNIHRQQVHANRLAEFIAEVQPDVIALQDWSSVNHKRLFGGGDWNVCAKGELLVASRYLSATLRY